MKMRLSHGSSLVISSGATTMITNTTTGDGASQRQLWAFELAGRLQMEWNVISSDRLVAVAATSQSSPERLLVAPATRGCSHAIVGHLSTGG